jgi:DNA-binding transcriptional LysR family regulator
MIPKISLEQWAAFKAVVDEGSFAKAAEVLNKSQSTVSYNLAKLEERLPAPVFVQQGRKAELTALGKELYRHASNLLAQALQLDQTARYLASGWEPSVTLAVDGLVPMGKVFCGLQQFSLQSPQTRIRILEHTLSGTEEALLRRDADIAILPRVPPGFMAQDFCTVTKLAVASPHHPLFSLPAPISEQDLRQHRQIVIRDSGTKREQDAGWLGSEQRWTVSHFASSVEAIKAGLGFGFIPEDKIEKELNSGELKRLPMAEENSQSINIYLVVTGQSNAGPAAKAVAGCLLKQA